jgi:hypothetical protein
MKKLLGLALGITMISLTPTVGDAADMIDGKTVSVSVEKRLQALEERMKNFEENIDSRILHIISRSGMNTDGFSGSTLEGAGLPGSRGMAPIPPATGFAQ